MPADAKSKRQSIRENVVKTLEEKTNVRWIATGLPVNFESVQSFPALFVTTGQERHLPSASFGPSMISELDIIITGLVQPDRNAADVDWQLDDLVKEVEDALQADPTRGHLAIDTRPAGIEFSDEPWHPTAAAQQRFTVRYEYTLGDR